MADPRLATLHARRFALRDGEPPDLSRASGDSGFVAHLSACTHGATGWDWNFRLARLGTGWAFVNDGRLTLFLDEANSWVPQDAKVGDPVAVRMPRARENLYPNRFTVFGGQGGPKAKGEFVKYFLPVTVDAAGRLVEAFTARAADQLHFALSLANAPQDFGRADAAVLDVGVDDEAGVVKILETFADANPAAFVKRGLPVGTKEGPLGLPRATATSRAELVDGFGWRRIRELMDTGGGSARESS